MEAKHTKHTCVRACEHARACERTLASGRRKFKVPKPCWWRVCRCFRTEICNHIYTCPCHDPLLRPCPSEGGEYSRYLTVLTLPPFSTALQAADAPPALAPAAAPSPLTPPLLLFTLPTRPFSCRVRFLIWRVSSWSPAPPTVASDPSLSTRMACSISAECHTTQGLNQASNHMMIRVARYFKEPH